LAALTGRSRRSNVVGLKLMGARWAVESGFLAWAILGKVIARSKTEIARNRTMTPLHSKFHADGAVGVSRVCMGPCHGVFERHLRLSELQCRTLRTLSLREAS